MVVGADRRRGPRVAVGAGFRDGGGMEWATFLSRLTLWVVVGAVSGLLVGLVLLGLDVVDNPFWCVSIGIVVAAVAMPMRRAVSREG